MGVQGNSDCHIHRQLVSLWQCEAQGTVEMCAVLFQVQLMTTHPNLTSTSTIMSAYGQSPSTATSKSFLLLHVLLWSVIEMQTAT
jgi:hypothetical protein